jgi:hypothetical protein
MKTALLAAALLAAPLPASAQSLQDQIACAKAAQKDAGDTVEQSIVWKEGWSVFAESHYNNKLHICMALIELTRNTSSIPAKDRILKDPIGGHVFAIYRWENKDRKKAREVKPWDCSFEQVPYGPEIPCETTEEFQAAIRPYMTD